MANSRKDIQIEGQLSIFDFINNKKVKLIRKNEYEHWRCNNCGTECPNRVIYGDWPYQGVRVAKRCPGCHQEIDIPKELQEMADYSNNYCTDNVSRCNRTEIWEKATSDCPQTCCHRCEEDCEAKKDLICRYTYNVCRFSGHTCNKENLWTIAHTFDDIECPETCCRNCNVRLCGVRCNGSKEPEIQESFMNEPIYPLDIRGICDDPYCPQCGYAFETTKTCKNYEVDCERCPVCHIKVDWSLWHRLNDEDKETWKE